jgi:release factor glutamine methyltransferase
MGDGESAGAVATVTVGEALRAAAAALEAAGAPDPRREADELYAALVGGATSAAWTGRERQLAPDGVARLAEAVARRAAGWPQAYAAARVNFRGHWLRVDERVLIPRPETEGLVELVLAWARARDGGAGSTARAGGAERRCGTAAREAGGLVAVDVGTGSGAIAVALAREGPFAVVCALDRSPEALEVAGRNAAALGVGDRVRLLRGDLLDALAGAAVDVVVSNPPYIATAELAELEPAVRRYEPRLALDGGPDGLAPTRRLAAAARDALVPGGLLALEADARRAEAAAALLRAAGFADVRVRNDLFERPRYVTALQPGDR